MENLVNIIGVENAILILAGLSVILLIAFVVAVIKIAGINKKYNCTIKNKKLYIL